MIRARLSTHLENLKVRFPVLADAEIRELLGRDYRYPLVVPKGEWIAMLCDLANEQEWSNFKNEAARFQGEPGNDYVRALHEGWGVNAWIAKEARKIISVSIQQ